MYDMRMYAATVRMLSRRRFAPSCVCMHAHLRFYCARVIYTSVSQRGPSGPQAGLWIFEMGLEFSLGLEWAPRKMYG